MDAINKVLMPLKPIYNGKIVILCDQPNSQQQADFDLFVSSYHLTENEDHFILASRSLEEYYPNGWTKTAAEVAIMQQNRAKVSYAQEVAEAITQAQFESGMAIIHAALLKTNERAFS